MAVTKALEWHTPSDGVEHGRCQPRHDHNYVSACVRLETFDCMKSDD
jgi:hypothetical protein